MKRQSQLLPYLIALTIILLLAQTSFYLSQRIDYFLAILVAQHKIEVPLTVWWPLVVFWWWQLVLNMLFTLAIWAITRLSCHYLQMSWQTTCRLGFTLWIIAVIAILMANQIAYPASTFSDLTMIFIPSFVAKIILIIVMIIIGMIASISLFALLKMIWLYKRLVLLAGFIATTAVTSSYAIITTSHHPTTTTLIASNKPNVFIIGIDALRPDHVSYYNGKHHDTPQLDHFLRSATNFTQSITPLARTYPAWVSILTGQYPKQNGVRFNLTTLSHNQKAHTLSTILKNHGYVTLFAIDSSRFAHIDASFGFDQVIAPPESADNFLIGTLNDSPLSNLLINTRLGSWLFPYSYGNRDVAHSYKPAVFSHQVEQQLLKLKHRPVFLAIHFCLAHWPYSWAKQGDDFSNGLDLNYRAAVRRVGQQAMDFIAFLKRQGFLHHAIVIVMSDHGEALGLPGDRLLNPKRFIGNRAHHRQVLSAMGSVNIDTPSLNTSYGHGTDVLSYSQYHNVLAIKSYGITPHQMAGNINTMVSLIDIKPTVLQWLGIKITKYHHAGLSLMPYLLGQKSRYCHQGIFVESGFSPTAINTGEISVFDAAFEGAQVFYINPQNNEVLMKPDAISIMIANNKQRAIYYHHWILAIYPQPHHRAIAIVVNRHNGKWSNDFSSSVFKAAPLKIMIAKLKAFYGKEITHFPMT